MAPHFHCIFLCSCAVRVLDSQAYRTIHVTRERIRHILELREMLLSFQTRSNLVNAAVVCAILGSISGIPSTSKTSTISCHKTFSRFLWRQILPHVAFAAPNLLPVFASAKTRGTCVNARLILSLQNFLLLFVATKTCLSLCKMHVCSC